MTHTYRFYVGSTDYYDAHDMSVRRIIRELLSFATIVPTAGVWDGTKEATAVVSAPATDDAQAHHVAALISARTGTDCVLVARMATADDAPTYRATLEYATTGDRTLYVNGIGNEGYRYVSDPRGRFVAWLVSPHGIGVI